MATGAAGMLSFFTEFCFSLVSTLPACGASESGLAADQAA